MAQSVSEKVLEAVKESSKDSRLPCSEAMRLAGRLGVSPAEVGRAADILGVKITACQLGCFGK